MKSIAKEYDLLGQHIPDKELETFELSSTCRKYINSGKLSTLSKRTVSPVQNINTFAVTGSRKRETDIVVFAVSDTGSI